MSMTQATLPLSRKPWWDSTSWKWSSHNNLPAGVWLIFSQSHTNYTKRWRTVNFNSKCYKDSIMNICKGLPRRFLGCLIQCSNPWLLYIFFIVNKNWNLFDTVSFLMQTSPVLLGFCIAYLSVCCCPSCLGHVSGIMITSNVLSKIMSGKIF